MYNLLYVCSTNYSRMSASFSYSTLISMNYYHKIQNNINIKQLSHDAGISMECGKDDFSIPTILEYNIQNMINVGVEIKVVVHLILSSLKIINTSHSYWNTSNTLHFLLSYSFVTTTQGHKEVYLPMTLKCA